jgi:hypothetical protein
MRGINTEKYSLIGRIFRFAAMFVIPAMVLGATTIAALNTRAYAGSGACEKDTKCGIGGKTFEAIYYSTVDSGLVILYEKGTAGTLKPWVSEKQYTKGTGTVEGAITYLMSVPYYIGYRVKKGEKSKGLFRSEVIDGLYVVEPRHEVMSNTRAPRYRFVEKDGTITLYITDFDRGREDDPKPFTPPVR